tara:strand:- start:351 stop:659 length:309 start_codon:yes stop_codon:yes gene_type:complete
MLKKFFLFILLILLTNCSAPGSALLGPAFTGAKTGSLYQASISYGTGKIMSELNSTDFFLKINSKQNNTTFNTSNDKDPIILLSYKIDKVEFSELIEPEPLP